MTTTKPSPRKISVVFGTRPEAIKLAPIVLHMRQRASEFDVAVCVTGQHHSMLAQALKVFDIQPEYNLKTMVQGQSLSQSHSCMLAGLERVLQESKPELVVVQGDTTSTLTGALAAFYQGIPVAHVEAGLRTGDLAQPFPEELNRVLTTRVASMHFAPTPAAAANLTSEGVPPERVVVTGNSGIDAVLYVADALKSGRLGGTPPIVLPPGRKLILVTAHRRESFGQGIENICSAIKRLADRSDVHIVYPVHRNPCVLEPVRSHLAGVERVTLMDTLDYVPFVHLMTQAYMLITDSGGVQEEGPSLGKPILVLREKTERPEAVAAGTVKLVGTDPEKIVREATTLLDDQVLYRHMCEIHNPYGDGHASRRIADAIVAYFAGVSATWPPALPNFLPPGWGGLESRDQSSC